MRSKVVLYMKEFDTSLCVFSETPKLGACLLLFVSERASAMWKTNMSLYITRNEVNKTIVVS